jgi:hypothetical protein
MKVASALSSFALLAVLVFPAHAAPPEAGKPLPLAEARKRVEAASEALGKAVKRIEKDPPSTEDLDAAHAAVAVLKDAIDAGAPHEPNDLAYARTALAARKQLRTQREYVDQRRANVHIHNHRRILDAALAGLAEQVRALEGKDPGPGGFDQARAAAEAVKKSVKEGRPFAGQDEAFARYLDEVDAKVARHQEAIDARWIQLSADKHQALLNESRQALSKAMTTLEKGRTDADFSAADRAAVDLTKRIEEGTPLEAKVKSYRADADRARGEVAQAKKRMEQLFADVGLDRLKAEIEPARKDLVSAGKALRARKPTEDQLAEARTAAIVVRKLVEKFQPQAQLSKPFGQYVDEVKKTLVEVEVELQRRTLEASHRDLAQALRTLERREPTDEHFAEAAAAQSILEKTLETVHTRDPMLMKPVADARELIRNARTTLPRRRLEVDVQRQKARVEEARKDAEAQVKQLQQPEPGKKMKEAEAAVSRIGTVLEEGAELQKKDRDYAAFAAETRKRVAELNDRISARKVALAAAEGRTQLLEAVANARAKLEAAQQPQARDAEVEAGSKSVEALTQLIEARGELEAKDRTYAANAERAREQLGRFYEALELARQARALRKATGEAFAAAASAADAGAKARELRLQKEHYEKAIARFKSCESEGTSMLKENAALARVAVLVEATPNPVRDVIALCGERMKATEQQLAEVMLTYGFEQGPKRSYELGKTLLAKSKKQEALEQFGECISSGMIHQHRYPEVKDRKFQVAGASLTVEELLDQCRQQRKTLLGQK